LGDTLRLETPGGSLARPVLGILEYYHSEKGTIFLDRKLYKAFWQDNALDYILITLSEELNVEALKSEIQKALAGEQQVFIYTHQEYKQWVTRLIDQFFTLTYLQMIVAIFVAALGLINTLVISVAERRREIGVMRAIGGLRSQIRRTVVLEAVAMTLVGIVTGIVSGILNAYFLVRTAATIIAGYTLPLHFPIGIVLLAVPATLLVALVAAWWPARRAVRMRVVEAISYE
jgi:putative ABC transport system permease protein